MASNDPNVSDNIYVRDLPVGADEALIRQAFGGYGVVVAVKVMGSKLGPNQKGAALVRYQSSQEAKWVVENLNGNIPHGLTEPIVCRFAQNKPGGQAQYGALGQAGPAAPSAFPPGQSPDGADNLWISGLPKEADEAFVKALFSEFGTVVQCKCLLNKKPGTPGAALVRFSSSAEAMTVHGNLNGVTPPGFTAQLTIKYADTPESKQAREAGAVDATNMVPGNGIPYGKGGGKGGGKGMSAGIEMVVKGFEASGGLPGSQGNVAAVFVGGLPVDTENFHLYRIFASFGAISPKGIKVMTNPDGTCKGFGFVNFNDAVSAEQACLTVNGTQLPNGSMMRVSIKSDNPRPY